MEEGKGRARDGCAHFSGPLGSVAFGARPGAAVLPAARDAQGRWLRAVALGGQGWFARARAELAQARRCAPAGGPGSLSLCWSTEASLVRQVGRHADAAVLDGRAFALAVDAPSRCDALTGLAADALGAGRLALAADLLARVEGLLDGEPEDGPLARQVLRRSWVRAELALARGEGPSALAHAAEGVRLAARWPSVRHQVKAALIHAAAVSTADAAAAAALGAACLRSADKAGLVPLAWAASMLLAGVDGAGDWARARDRYAGVLARRCGSVG